MKTIAFIDQTLFGHKLAYMRYHVKIAAELGHRVLCISPDIDLVSTWINENYPELSNQILYFAFDDKPFNIPVTGKWKTMFAKLRDWKKYAAVIKHAAADHHVKIDLVFFNWLDGMVMNYLHPFLLNVVFPYKWSGIYFHPQLLRFEPEILQQRTSPSAIDIALSSKNCIAVALHDEGVISGQSYRLFGKKVFLFPEIADSTPADLQHPVYKAIREKAAGRIVIGMLGLDMHKGSADLMHLAKRMDPSKYFFAFTGPFEEFYLNYFPEGVAQEFKAFISNPRENVYVKTGNLEEGREYNSVFSAFDIVYIVYKNFPSASNRLTKAAQLNRLVIADEKYCVGEDVRKYNLGATANGDDLNALEKSIAALRDRILKNDFPAEEWKVYAHRNSLGVLKERFKELIDLL